MTRRRRVLVGVLCVAAVVAVVVWRGRSGSPRRAAPAPGTGAPALDVARLRDATAQQRQAVRNIAARFPRPADATAPRRSTIFTRLLSPACFIGPLELCDTLLEPAGACADGDASACLAVGQYIADTPPRSNVALMFFRKACELGDAEACARSKQPGPGEALDCAADPVRCAQVARTRNDIARGEQACDLGAADACDFLAREAAIRGDRAQVRAYLAKGCQFGSPMLCEMLGERLAPSCKGDCLAPDAEEAAAALTFACESGFVNACDGVAPP